MLNLAGVGPGMRVLDVAAGAGDQTLDISARVGPSGRVLAVDLSPALIDIPACECVSRRCAEHRHPGGELAETLEFEAGSFDAAVSRLGLMLMARPLEALRRMHQALRPRAMACSLVFGRLERNPCISILMQTACRHAGLPPRDPFLPGSLLSLGKPGLMDDLFIQAGSRRGGDNVAGCPVPDALGEGLHPIFARGRKPGPADSVPSLACGRRRGMGRHGASRSAVRHSRWLGGSERVAADRGQDADHYQRCTLAGAASGQRGPATPPRPCCSRLKAITAGWSDIGRGASLARYSHAGCG